MFNRRDFLTGLVASPAAALASEVPALSISVHTIWVIVGVNWTYNDEYSYAEGDFLTEHAFADEEAAKRKCEELIQEFRKEEDPEDFVHRDITLPDDWEDRCREQRWDWLFGISPTPEEHKAFVCCEDGYGWVEIPFEVREMRLPRSAVQQLHPTGGRR